MLEILITILIVIMAYYPTLGYGLIIDDLHYRKLVDRGSVRRNPRLWLYGGGTLGKSVKLDHAFAICLHAVVCSLIAYVFNPWAGVLYAVNPANHQSAIWLNGRRYQVNILLMLVIMLAGPWGLLLWPLTWLYQINALFLPVYFSWWGLLLVPVGVFALRRRIKHRWSKIPNNSLKDFTPKRLIVVVKTYGYYFTRMIFPGVGLMYHRYLYYWGMSDEGDRESYRIDYRFFVGVGALVLSAGIVYWYGTVGLFFLLAVLQWCNAVTCTMTLADRYMSLPNVLMMYFITDISFTFLGGYASILLSGLFVYYLIRLRDTLPMYRDIEQCYRNQIWWEPEGISARSFYIRDLLLSKKYAQAWTQVAEGLHYNPRDFRFLLQAAQCAYFFGEKESANQYLNKAQFNMYRGQEVKLKGLVEQVRGMINAKTRNKK